MTHNKLLFSLIIILAIAVAVLFVHTSKTHSTLDVLSKRQNSTMQEFSDLKFALQMGSLRSLHVIEKALKNGLVNNENQSAWAEFALSIPSVAGDLPIFQETFEHIISDFDDGNQLVDVMKSNKHLWFDRPARLHPWSSHTDGS